METIFDRLFHKRPRADAEDMDCAARYSPVERTGCEPADGEDPREAIAAEEDAALKEQPLASQTPLLPKQETLLKLPFPAKREIVVKFFPKLHLNRETEEILKDDKIATGG